MGFPTPILGGFFYLFRPLLGMPSDDYSGPQGRQFARQTREALFERSPEPVKRLMRQAASERREKARKEWKAKNSDSSITDPQNQNRP